MQQDRGGMLSHAAGSSSAISTDKYYPHKNNDEEHRHQLTELYLHAEVA